MIRLTYAKSSTPDERINDADIAVEVLQQHVIVDDVFFEGEYHEEIIVVASLEDGSDVLDALDATVSPEYVLTDISKD